MDYGAEAIVRHRASRGKLSIASKMKVETMEELSIAYTPGVAAVSMAKPLRIRNCLKIDAINKNRDLKSCLIRLRLQWCVPNHTPVESVSPQYASYSGLTSLHKNLNNKQFSA